jgi:hypothetical protein
MSSAGAASRAAIPVSNARAEASRRNGARSRGPKTAAGKARSSRNALKHGLRAQKLLVLPEEDAAQFEALEAALLAELAPQGALQAVLAQRIVSAAWRLMRADRLEAEVLAFRGGPDADLGLALIRDGNGTRSVETVMRYRNAAMAELLRAQKTLQALKAEQAAPIAARAVGVSRVTPSRKPTAPALVSHRAEPNEPEPRSIDDVVPDQPEPGRTLHESAVPWMPSEPEAVRCGSGTALRRAPDEPKPRPPIAAVDGMGLDRPSGPLSRSGPRDGRR